MRWPPKGHDQKVLNLFRGPGPCANCAHFTHRREAHHVIACGQGAGSTLDLPINLVALDWHCHRDIQGRIEEGCRLVAIRFPPLTAAEIENQLRLLLRAPKGCKPCWRCQGSGRTVFPSGRYRDVIRSHPCLCGTGILLPTGEAWVEQPRKFAGS